MEYDNYIVGEQIIRIDHALLGLEDADERDTVSYTHLDVYKRQVGDLTASAIKRNYDIKDYGKLIPGHGGILDRFDSMIITCLLYTSHQ